MQLPLQWKYLNSFLSCNVDLESAVINTSQICDPMWLSSIDNVQKEIRQLRPKDVSTQFYSSTVLSASVWWKCGWQLASSHRYELRMRPEYTNTVQMEWSPSCNTLPPPGEHRERFVYPIGSSVESDRAAWPFLDLSDSSGRCRSTYKQWRWTLVGPLLRSASQLGVRHESPVTRASQQRIFNWNAMNIHERTMSM